MDLIKAIETRRSVRKFKADKVSDGDLHAVLEAARFAPSWKNTQTWRFVVVRDEQLKLRVADIVDQQNPSLKALKQAPVFIAACAELGKSGRDRGEFATDKGDWFMFDNGLAMENAALAAHSLGLGTVFMGLFDAEKAAEILEVPNGYSVVVLMLLGYPDEFPKGSPRKEYSEIVFYEKFGKANG